MEIFKIENVSFTFAGSAKKVLNDVDCVIEAGAFTVIIGTSGSGKSTFLQLLKKELTPNGELSGRIFFMNQPIEQIDKRRAAKEIGYVMQNPDDQIVMDTVWHELAFGLENLGLTTDEIRMKVAEITNYFGMQHWFHSKTSDLSGGQKQLLNLASILIMRPRVIILDEPTSQLDPITASNFIQILHKIHEDMGITIIIVEHRLEDVFPLATQVIVLEDGHKLVEEHPRLIGMKLKEIDVNHPMLQALPSAMYIASTLEDMAIHCPITVREGMQWLTKYNNAVRVIEELQNIAHETEVVLEAKSCSYRYQRDLNDVVKDCSLRIKKGEIFCILGGNGSGKTTLLNILSAQLKPYEGHIIVNKKKMKKYKIHELYRGNIAVLPQNPKTLFLKATVQEDYEYFLKSIGQSSQELALQINRMAEQLGIQHLLNVHPYNVSGGELQKIALGKILLSKPRIIFLDEPTKGIDTFNKRQLQIQLQNLQQEGVTFIVVTHDTDFAAHIANRCALFFDGSLLSTNTPRLFFSKNEFYTTSAHKMTNHHFDNVVTCEDAITLCLRNELRKELRV